MKADIRSGLETEVDVVRTTAYGTRDEIRMTLQTPLDQSESPDLVCHPHLYVPSELHEQVQKAAIAAGPKTPPWLRTMVRQVTNQDFPAS